MDYRTRLTASDCFICGWWGTWIRPYWLLFAFIGFYSVMMIIIVPLIEKHR